MTKVGRPGKYRGRAGQATVLGTALVVALGLGMPATNAATALESDPAGSAPDGTEPASYTLTILHTNDMESALLGIDPEDDGLGSADAPYGGAARHATLWDQLRVQALVGRQANAPSPEHGEGESIVPRGPRGVLSLSAGDAFLAGAQFDASQERGVPFYDAIAQQRLRLDAAVIGNHEFDFGPETLADFMDSFDGSDQFLTANLDVSAEPSLADYAESGELAASTVVRKSGERIGVIGLTTPDLPALSSPGEVEVLDDLADIVNAEVNELEDQGVNKIILASHLQGVDADLELVEDLRGVDAVVAGGGGEILANDDDTLIPGDEPQDSYPLWATDSEGTDVPVVTVTGSYKYIGQLALEFDAEGTLLEVDEDNSRPVRVSGVDDDAVDKDRYTRERVEEPVAEHIADLEETVVAESEVELDGVRDSVRTGETNLGNLLADAVVWSAAQRADEFGLPEPVVGIQNGGGIRNDAVISAGPVTAFDTHSVAPFANFVTVLPEVPRDRFRQLLERGVAEAPTAAGSFIQISGASFAYDPEQVAQEVDPNSGEILVPGERVQDVELDDGTVIVQDGEVVDGPAIPLATQDFSAQGGDGYPLADLEATSVETAYQEALQSYLEDGLEATVSATDYPEGGDGRITQVD